MGDEDIWDVINDLKSDDEDKTFLKDVLLVISFVNFLLLLVSVMTILI